MFSKRREVITAQTFSCFGIDVAWPTDRLAEKMGIVLEEENPGCGGQRFSSTVLKAGFTSGESPKYELWLKNSITRKSFLFCSMLPHFMVLQNSGNIKFPQFHTRKTELKSTRKKKKWAKRKSCWRQWSFGSRRNLSAWKGQKLFPELLVHSSTGMIWTWTQGITESKTSKIIKSTLWPNFPLAH